MTQRRIAMISEHASPLALLGGEDAGGQNVYVSELARELARHGMRVDVFTRRDRETVPEVVAWGDGVRVVNVAAGPPSFVKKDLQFPYMPSLRDGILQFARRSGLRYDLVHSHFWMSAWVGCELRERWRVPHAVTFHALGAIKRRYQGTADTSPPERAAAEQRVLDEADAIVSTCPNEVEELRTFYRLDERKVSIVPCGVNPEIFQPVTQRRARQRLGWSKDDQVVLCVSRMVPRKGIETAIQGVAELERDWRGRLRLVIVGGDQYAVSPMDNLEVRRLARVARSVRLGNTVTFVGSVPQSDLRYYYSAADVFVSTPWYEPFGITPLEAMACGTPVIASRVGGHKFTVLPGRTGLLVPPRDPQALETALRRLLGDGQLRERMRQQAVARVRNHFTWQRVADGVARVYESMLREEDVLPVGTAPPDRARRAVRRG